MHQNVTLFSDNKRCTHCGKLLPNDYRFEVCAACEEYELFDQVRDFIREHKVTEYDVAKQFDLPIRKVRAWIKEGRIDYNPNPKKLKGEIRCKNCGTPIALGEYCSACLRHGKAEIIFNPNAINKDGSEFRYFK